MFVGVVGAGQLGRMMALDGYRLGIRFRFYESNPAAPGAELAELVCGEYDDIEALARFADGLDCITYEFENIPHGSMKYLENRVPVYPSPRALAVSQERLFEKQMLNSLDIPTAPFAPVDYAEHLQPGLKKVGLPAVLKTRRFGYDGKGQAIIKEADQALKAWERIEKRPAILEGFIPFQHEVSIVAARSRSGETAYYPLAQNLHKDGILRLSIAPAPCVNPELQAKAEEYARRVLEDLQYVGVLAIEFFLKDGELLANEMAPRVHNSGHWSIEGAECSQFENHLRAVCGLPLGCTKPRGSSAMINLIGELPDLHVVYNTPGAHLHLYNKSPRPGRKLGHVNLRSENRDELAQTLPSLVSSLGGKDINLSSFFSR